MPMKILYAGRISTGSSSVYRMWTLQRFGHNIVSLDPHTYTIKNSLLSKVAFRLSAGPHAQRLNRDLVSLAESERPDVFWSDKGLLVQPGTLKRMRELGIVTVSYMIDNAFGPRKDPGWRLHIKDIPHYDLHVTQRDVSVQDYFDRGARDVIKIQTAFEETIHFPPSPPYTDAQRTRDVSFIGAPYDDRADLLTRLSDDGISVIINGPPRAWSRALRPDAFTKMVESAELWEKDYRETIWTSRINISFLTKANLDEYTHKSFEIAACGGFLLAERCPGHMLKFKEDEEAIFFGDYAELKAKILKYLPHEVVRNRIAAAGHARAVRYGYGNNAQMGLVMERVEKIIAAKLQEIQVTR
jgi:spore maturation protein CgeB